MSEETKEKKFLKLEEILYSNATNDVYIPAIDRYVKIKNASIRDRREAEKLAVLHPAWNSMSSNDKEAEVVRMLALQIMVEPKITYEDYINAEDTIIQIILNAVANEYYLRLNELMKEKSGKDIGDFLVITNAAKVKLTGNKLKQKKIKLLFDSHEYYYKYFDNKIG